jgi:lipid A ethanolaminephosphotransferase
MVTQPGEYKGELMRQRWPISSEQLLLLTSLFFTVALNWTFFERIYNYLNTLPETNPLFWLAIPVAVFTVFYFLLSLFLVPGIARFLLALVILGSALVSLLSVRYGIIFDYTMIDNFIETDSAEAKTYFNLFNVSYVLLLGVVPTILMLRTHIIYRPLKQELTRRSFGVLTSIIVFAVIAGLFYKDFAATGRNNEHVHQYLVPNQMVYSIGKYITKNFVRNELPYKDLTAGTVHTHKGAYPELMVLVLGETARASNFSWNGYSRDTNRYTKAAGFMNMGNVTACGTATAYSVPCMFSLLDRENYSADAASHQSNILDIVRAADFDVRWIENNSSCKGVCRQSEMVKIPTDASDPLCDGEYCFDEVLVQAIERTLAEPLERDTLIVLHMIGSHGPTYYRRYPKQFREFTPDCPRSDIQNCNTEQIVNSYDNTILYTDYVLEQISRQLTRERPKQPSVLLYISDHGESLGEHGLYLHGMPYQLAPEEQRTVPELLWLSEGYLAEHDLSSDCLSQSAFEHHASHDNLSYTILGLLGIESRVYAPELDLAGPCMRMHKHVSTSVTPTPSSEDRS